MRKRFEIKWPDANGPDWLNPSNLLACLTAHCRNTEFSVCSVTHGGVVLDDHVTGRAAASDGDGPEACAVAAGPHDWIHNALDVADALGVRAEMHRTSIYIRSGFVLLVRMEDGWHDGAREKAYESAAAALIACEHRCDESANAAVVLRETLG